jgi:hypothetical protein
LSKQLKKSLYEETAPKCDVFLVFFIWGGSINLKFVFSVSSLVYLEKYGLKKYEGQKKHSCTALHSMFYNMPEYEGVFIGYL